MCKIALFYFFKRRYEYYEDAATEALDIIKKVAESDQQYLIGCSRG
jgi:hypothetical protein